MNTADPVLSPYIVRADRLAAYRSAREIVADADALAAKRRSELAGECDAALAAARTEGLRLGLEEAASLTAQAASALELFWHEREQELAELALAVAHRVLASLPADETTTRLALAAIAEHRRDVPLALRLAPDAARFLRETLRDMESGDRVTIIADPDAPPGACTLVHPRGRTEIGLLAQFRAMMQGLSAGEPT